MAVVVSECRGRHVAEGMWLVGRAGRIWLPDAVLLAGGMVLGHYAVHDSECGFIVVGASHFYQALNIA